MSRVFLIALDGADFQVLDFLFRKGIMPFLEEFSRVAVKADLLSTVNPVTPPAFTSMVTGRDPGAHGIFDFLKKSETGDSVFFNLCNSLDVKCETVWQIVSRYQKKVGVLNFVLTAPPYPVKGYIVPGMIPWKHLRRHVHPPELFSELKALPGFDTQKISWDPRVMGNPLVLEDERERADKLRVVLEKEQQWFNVAIYLLRKYPVDLFGIVFGGVDHVQHTSWKFLTPELIPSSLQEWEKKNMRVAYEYFSMLDGFLKEILKFTREEDYVFVVSDHGFRGWDKMFKVNQFLCNLGYLTWASPQPGGGFLDLDLDWSKTIAFTPTVSVNGIYIRVARKEGEVGVPEKEYLGFRKNLKEKLLEVRDPRTGKRALKEVLFREEAFHGKEIELAPDLTLIPEDDFVVGTSSADSLVEYCDKGLGIHRREGIFLGKGPGLRKATRVEGFSVQNIAPLLLYTLGISIPENIEGKVPEEIFEKEFISYNPPLIEGRAREGKELEREEEYYTPEEEAEIYRKLKDLGYLE